VLPHLDEMPAGRADCRPRRPASAQRQANTAFLDYFRCPEHFAQLEPARDMSEEAGYFTLGDTICYGRMRGRKPARDVDDRLPDGREEASPQVGSPLRLCFDLTEVVTNLREERYRQHTGRTYLARVTGTAAARSLYYFLRPVLPVPIRKYVQRVRLAGWKQITFPHWPVDTTVDALMHQTLALLLTSQGVRQVPFIWFWPDGAPGCAMMTHDIESMSGREFCGELMDLDDSFGIKSAFQVVPEMRDETPADFADGVRRRGFEVNLHDLTHDGSLFRTRSRFLQQAAQINRHARDLHCRGFRSGSMYREQRWFDALEFSYDMSVPNVAHLEPQRGGCCTVMPYFIGEILELPLTTIEDYSLFHILGEYSTAVWKEQVELILARNGLISFLAHPDYVAETRARAVYVELLTYLAGLRATRNLWIAPPAEVDRWWRNRQNMRLVPNGDSWQVEGPDSGRARVAYASLEDDRIVYTLSGAA
jgi:hypothetical protein